MLPVVRNAHEAPAPAPPAAAAAAAARRRRTSCRRCRRRRGHFTAVAFPSAVVAVILPWLLLYCLRPIEAFLVAVGDGSGKFRGGNNQRSDALRHHSRCCSGVDRIRLVGLFAKSRRGGAGGDKTTAGGGGGGFGTPPPPPSDSKKRKKSDKGNRNTKTTTTAAAAAAGSSATRVHKPYVKSEQEDLIASLTARSARSCLGRAAASSPAAGTPDADPFWELIPSLIQSRFPAATDEQLHRVAGFVRHAVGDPDFRLEDSIISDPYRRDDEIHAYMPGLGPTEPFRNPDQVELCRLLSENYDTILQEYRVLLSDMDRPDGVDRFQSVTSMNYDSGWRTLVLFYNGHRIEGFPYHLCPVTTRILETVPLAGRIAGFNRQQPETGIPLHTDGNNMWLTCQMGLIVPDNSAARIRVGPETRYWKAGECLLYDTTYEHETFNAHPTQERVVLHVDFFNTVAMTATEIEVMRYIYSLREEFMKAEGAAKVGAQIL